MSAHWASVAAAVLPRDGMKTAARVEAELTKFLDQREKTKWRGRARDKGRGDGGHTDRALRPVGYAVSVS